MSAPHAKQILYLPGTLLCGVFLLCSCTGGATNNPRETPVLSGAPATSLPMPPLNSASLTNMGWVLSDGKRDLFSSYKGKVLVLDFYATWCVPCRESVPHLIELQKQFSSQGLIIVGLNVGGPGDPERVPDFARELGIHYTLATPDDELVTFLLSGSDAIPQTFVFDRRGLLVERFIGFESSTAERLDRAIDSALQTQPDHGAGS